MRPYKVQKVEIKNADWKVATLLAPDGYPTENVSVNRKNKKGEVFPNFDGIVEGANVEGVLWKSDAQKWYLFAPDEKKAGNGANFANNGGAMRMMDKKNTNVREAMDAKEKAVKIASTMRDAVLLAIAQHQDPNVPPNLAEAILQWRQWLWLHWDDPEEPNYGQPF